MTLATFISQQLNKVRTVKRPPKPGRLGDPVKRHASALVALYNVKDWKGQAEKLGVPYPTLRVWRSQGWYKKLVREARSEFAAVWLNAVREKAFDLDEVGLYDLELIIKLSQSLITAMDKALKLHDMSFLLTAQHVLHTLSSIGDNHLEGMMQENKASARSFVNQVIRMLRQKTITAEDKDAAIYLLKTVKLIALEARAA